MKYLVSYSLPGAITKCAFTVDEPKGDCYEIEYSILYHLCGAEKPYYHFNDDNLIIDERTSKIAFCGIEVKPFWAALGDDTIKALNDYVRSEYEYRTAHDDMWADDWIEQNPEKDRLYRKIEFMIVADTCIEHMDAGIVINHVAHAAYTEDKPDIVSILVDDAKNTAVFWQW